MGFGGEDVPAVTYPTVHGNLRHPSLKIGGTQDSYLGEEALAKRGILTLRWPIQHGNITNFEDTAALWKYGFYNQLRVAPEECNVVISEPPFVPNMVREKTLQIFMEEFNVPGYYTNTSGVLGMMACGIETGMAIELGHELCAITPVFEGRSVSAGMYTFHVSGQNLTDYLMHLISERGIYLTTTAERVIARHAKEQLGFCASDRDARDKVMWKTFDVSTASQAERELVAEVDFEIPGVCEWKLGTERWRCVEPLFFPSMIGFSAEGLPGLIWNSLHKQTPEHRLAMMQSITLMGGSSLFPGLGPRLKHELTNLLPNNAQFDVITHPDRHIATWKGASLLTTKENFPSLLITKDEYDEVGPSLIHTKWNQTIKD
jgi:actin-related protein